VAKKKPESGERHPFIAAYLKRLEVELRSVDEPEASAFIDRVRAEFEARLAGIEEPTDKQVLAISARLGQPRQLVVEAGLVEAKAANPLSCSDLLLSRGAVAAGLIALGFTFYSSLIAAIIGAVALILTIACMPRWARVKNSVVVGVMLVVAVAIILAVQLLGAAQTA